MRIYLAARYSRREELCSYREELRRMGHDVQARWLDGGHQISDQGIPIGQHGEALVEGDLCSGEILSEDARSRQAAALRAKFANDDFEDVTTASCLIAFTELPRSSPSRGGRHVEFGIALAYMCRIIIVGPRENIFHWLDEVEVYGTWDQAKANLQLVSSHV